MLSNFLCLSLASRGYWLNDVITARASWDPQTGVSHREALKSQLQAVFSSFGAAQDELTAITLDLIDMERDLLIYGKVGDKEPSSVRRSSYKSSLTFSNLMGKEQERKRKKKRLICLGELGCEEKWASLPRGMGHLVRAQ